MPTSFSSALSVQSPSLNPQKFLVVITLTVAAEYLGENRNKALNADVLAGHGAHCGLSTWKVQEEGSSLAAEPV